LTALDVIYDIFISYSPADQAWILDDLLPRLLAADLTVIADHRDFASGEAWRGDGEIALWRSRVVILVLSSDTNGSRRAHIEALLDRFAKRALRAPRVLAVVLAPLEPGEFAERLALLKPLDLTNLSGHPRQMRRLLRRLGRQRTVYLCYQHDNAGDAALAEQLATQLERAGHKVESSQILPGDTNWVTETQRRIVQSDFVVVLLSAASAHSELVAQEIEFCQQCFLKDRHPGFLPVRMDYHDPLPYQIRMYLGPIPSAEWRGPGDTRRLLVQLCDAIGHGEALRSPAQPASDRAGQAQPVQPPGAYADPQFIESLDAPGGTVRLDSDFYMERSADATLRRILARQRGGTTTIRAPRQTGKSSLLIRGMTQAQAQGSKPIFIDLQPVDSIILENLNRFLRYFATTIVDKLKLDPRPVDRIWAGPLAPTNKLTEVIEEYILPQSSTKIMLAIDEADRLLNTDYRNVVFGLIRSWHNNRVLNDLWDNLDILMVIATEPNMLIEDISQSPFNIGLTIALEDFDPEQVAELNARYRSPIEVNNLPELIELLGGHPYLTSLAFYTKLTENVTWEQLTRSAASDKGPFSDHLRRYSWLLRDRPELQAAIKEISARGSCSDERAFFRLLQAGLVKGADNRACAFRCRLYAEYLGREPSLSRS
jgi:hypothetical protein